MITFTANLIQKDIHDSESQAGTEFFGQKGSSNDYILCTVISYVQIAMHLKSLTLV